MKYLWKRAAGRSRTQRALGWQKLLGKLGSRGPGFWCRGSYPFSTAYRVCHSSAISGPAHLNSARAHLAHSPSIRMSPARNAADLPQRVHLAHQERSLVSSTPVLTRLVAMGALAPVRRGAERPRAEKGSRVRRKPDAQAACSLSARQRVISHPAARTTLFGLDQVSDIRRIPPASSSPVRNSWPPSAASFGI